MIGFRHIFNDIDNHCELNIITQSMSLEYSLHDVDTLIGLRNQLDDVIDEIKEVEQLDEKERLNKWLNGGKNGR
jgi:hypothetical protein